MIGYDGTNGSGNARVTAGTSKGFSVYVGGGNGSFQSGVPALYADVNGLISRSVASAVSAAGSTLSDAAALTKNVSIVTTVASGAGVVLAAWPNTANVATHQVVINSGANALLIYPPSASAVITAGTTANPAGAAVSLAVGAKAEFYCYSSTQCRQVQ
jgi:hypothetical protein